MQVADAVLIMGRNLSRKLFNDMNGDWRDRNFDTPNIPSMVSGEGIGWEIPYGPIYTIQAIYHAFTGEDVTHEVVNSINKQNEESAN